MIDTILNVISTIGAFINTVSTVPLAIVIILLVFKKPLSTLLTTAHVYFKYQNGTLSIELNYANKEAETVLQNVERKEKMTPVTRKLVSTGLDSSPKLAIPLAFSAIEKALKEAGGKLCMNTDYEDIHGFLDDLYNKGKIDTGILITISSMSNLKDSVSIVSETELKHLDKQSVSAYRHNAERMAEIIKRITP